MEIPLIKPPRSRNLKAGKVILRYGEEIGMHVTDGREELVVVLKGSATLIVDKKRLKLDAGEARFIGEETKHNIRNDSFEPLEYVYIVARFPGKGRMSD